MENAENNKLAQAVLEALSWFAGNPLVHAKSMAIKLGAEAYRLKAKGERNSIYFTASRALGAAVNARDTIKRYFIFGWGQEKAEQGGFPESVDLPGCLRGYYHLRHDAYELLAQRGDEK